MTEAPSLPRPGLVLYVIRHGETDWNAESRYQGQRDIPLNARGREQAARNGAALGRHLREAGVALDDLDFQASPLLRARDTMRLAREAMGLPPEGARIEPLLRELHYGHWQGQLAADLPQTDPEGLAARKRDPFHARPKGGESFADLMARTDAWLATVTRDTVAATHGGVLRTLRGRLLDIERSLVPRLPVPQDRVLVLRTGAMGWI